MSNWNRSNEWTKNKRQEELKNNPDAIQCLICGRKYIQVGSHIFQTHHMTARKYREKFGLDVKRGLTQGGYRKLKADKVFENGTVKNLELGKQYRLKKGEAIPYIRSKQTLERLHNMKHLFKKKDSKNESNTDGVKKL